jgi:hypothetical protein
VTLIAGFHSFGTPVLIGDFLTTSSGDRYGLRKKVLLVADNCALAWTGHLVAANSVVTSLQDALGRDAVTLESVKGILTDPATSRLGTLQVSLICWVAERQGAHCFRWRSDYPHELFLGSPMYDGSGDSFVQALAGEGLRDSASSKGTNPKRAVEGALHVTTELMWSEMFGPTTKPQGFGFAYEVLCLVDGQRFEYLNNVLYFAITCELDGSGKYMRGGFSGPVYKYEAHGNFTGLYVYDPSTRTQSRYVVPPVGLYSEQAETELLQRMAKPQYRPFPFDSDHYCAFVLLKAPNFSCPPTSMYFGRKAAQVHKIIDISKPNEISLKVPPDMVERMYRAIQDDQRGVN